MARAKFIDFRFSIPVSSFAKENGTFVSLQIGQIIVDGRARINKEKLEDLPIAFADTDEVNILLESIRLAEDKLTASPGAIDGNVNLLPMLLAISSAKPMLDMITSQARAHVKTIYDNENF